MGGLFRLPMLLLYNCGHRCRCCCCLPLTLHPHLPHAPLQIPLVTPFQVTSLNLARAGILSAGSAAPVLLAPSSLEPGSFAHEKNSQSRRLVALWEESGRQVRGGLRGLGTWGWGTPGG